jgi:carbon-monoxide dehydrogenase medium subunit
VKPAAFDYAAPTSLDEALQLLAANDTAKVLAGGQSLIPLLNLRLAEPELLIDLRRVPGLNEIARQGNELVIGATVRQRQAERDPLVAEDAPLITAALAEVGHPQIRSRGTVGGSIAHADPAAELPAALVALDGRVIARGPGGERSIPAADFYLGFLTTALDDDEILVAVALPAAPPRTGAACVEIAQRAGDYAACGAVAQVTLDDAGTIAQARVALIGAGRRGEHRGCRPPRGRRGRADRRPARSLRLSHPPRRRGHAPGARAGKEPRRMSTHTIRVTVNGTEHEAEVPARLTLADFLRERLDLTATHLGCEHGVCGACTILLDGETARSCIMLAAQADGSEITTLEGVVAEDEDLHPVQQAFWDRHGLQCGFCTPGIIMSTLELLREHPEPTREQIDDALGGHLCRCTGYVKIVEAVEQAAGELRRSRA